MTGFLRSATFVAGRDLAQSLRERETLIWAFIMPVVFFFFIGTVTGGMSGTSDPDRPDRLALRAPADSGFLLDELIVRLEDENYAVERPESDEELAQYSRRLTVPEPEAGGLAFTDAVLAGEQVTVRFGRSGEGPAAQLDQVRVARAVYGLLADLVVASADRTAGTVTRGDIRLVAEAPRTLTLASRPAGERRDPPSGFEQAIPGTIVMFTLVMALTGGGIQLVIEREQGLLRRLASTPIPRGAIVLGKLGTRVGLGLLQVTVGMIAGSLLFGLDWGASLWMVVLLLAAWAIFSATLGLVIGNLARSEAQMNGIGTISSMALAALGGCWWPIEITPDWMQSLALLLPTGWAMDAMHRLISFGYDGSAALPHLAGLLVLSGMLGWLGARTFRFQ